MTSLSDLDQVVVPDRWSQISERAAGPDVDLVVFDVAERRRRRLAPAAVVLATTLLVAGTVASRSGRDETVTAAPTPSSSETATTDAPDASSPLSSGTFAHPILVDGGLGREGLLRWLWTELLAWPGEPAWQEIDGVPRATHPDNGNWLSVSLVPNGEGWAVEGFFVESGIRPLLDDDAHLAGFVRLGTPSTEVASAEVLEIVSPADSRPLEVSDWGDETIELATPIEARAARSYLVITRDDAGGAIELNGWAFGQPDRLDLDLDVLLSEPGVADPVAGPLGVDLGGRLEPPRRLQAVWPGVDGYLSPLEDRSALCLTLVEPDDSAATTCAYATDFNQRGIKIGSQADGEDPWIVLVVPESTQLGDLGDAVVHPSGIAIAWTASGTAIEVANRFELIDGALQPSSTEAGTTLSTGTTLDGTLAGFGYDSSIVWTVPTRGSVSGRCELLEPDERISASQPDAPSVIAVEDPGVLGQVFAGPDGRVAVHSNCTPTGLHIGRTDGDGRLDVEPLDVLGDFVQHHSLRFTPDERLTVIRRIPAEDFRGELVSLDPDTNDVAVLLDAATVLPSDPSALVDAAVLDDGTLVVHDGGGITIGDVQVASTGASRFHTNSTDTVWVQTNGGGVQQFDAQAQPIGPFHPDAGVVISPTGRWQLLTPTAPSDDISTTSILLREGIEVARIDHPGEFAEAISDNGTIALTDVDTATTRLITP